MRNDTNEDQNSAELAVTVTNENWARRPASDIHEMHPRLADSERHKLLFDWNQTETEYPAAHGVQQLFEKQVERSPDSVAIAFAGEQLSYAEVNRRANQLAHLLRSKGVGPNSLVGIHVGRSPEFVIAILGILKAGGAYVPLDPEYPVDRLDFMIADAEAKVIVCGSDLSGEFNYCDHCDVVALPLSTKDSQGPIENPVCVNAPKDLAYVMYTSGSTGRPKGVCMPHRQLLNLVHWQNSQSLCRKGERTLQFAPLGFDVCFQEIFSTLSCGGALVIAPNKERKDFASLLRLIEASEINRLFLPFVALEHLAEVVEDSARPLVCVREVITAGEQLRVTPAVRRLFQRLKGARLINQYGPTEAHVVSAYELGGNPFDWPFWPPIGKPIANTQLYILDAELEPVPAGVPGDLYIGGAQVAPGYLKRPELTAEKFIPDPFSRTAEARLYRTDDSAKYLPDGDIEFLGRTDDQVKIRGFRVEPGEIEAVLCEHPDVRQCVVVARENSSGGKLLTAYFRANGNANPATDDLREFLKRKLPDYMLPVSFVSMTAFPLTPNGKVDRKSLPVPEADSTRNGVYVAPCTEIERKMTEIWQTLFQRPRLGLHDSFFDLGGHSLLAVRLIGEINRELNAHLDVLSLQQHPTIEKLSRALLDGHELPSGPKLVPLESGGSGSPIFFFQVPMEVSRLIEMAQSGRPSYISEVPFASEILQASAQHNHALFPRVAEMAAPHAALIRDCGFGNPCVLAGFSDGGNLAFEIAHQLIRGGITVEAVLLFDSDMKMPNFTRYKRHLRNSFQPGYLRQQVRRRFYRERDERAAKVAVSRDGANPEVFPDFSNPEEAWEITHRIWQHALKSYRPRPLASRGILFRAQESIFNEINDYDGCLGWGRLFAGGLKIFQVPGGHMSMWKGGNLPELSESFGVALGIRRGTADVG